MYELPHDMMAKRVMNMENMQLEDSCMVQHYAHITHSYNFHILLKDVKVELYLGCKNFTKLFLPSICSILSVLMGGPINPLIMHYWSC